MYGFYHQKKFLSFLRRHCQTSTILHPEPVSGSRLQSEVVDAETLFRRAQLDHSGRREFGMTYSKLM